MKPTSPSPISSPICARRPRRRRTGQRNQRAVAAAIAAAAAGDGEVTTAQRQQQFTRIHHRLQQQHRICWRASRRCCSSCSAGWKTACSNSCAAARRSERAQQRLAQVQPQGRIHRYQRRVQQQEYRLQQAMGGSSTPPRFGVACSQLETVSPLATLARGCVTQTARRAAENHQTGAGRRTAENPPAGWLGGKRGENHHRRQKPRKKRAAE